MDRVIVAGISGSGKTTFARRLAALRGLPHHELDALHHGRAATAALVARHPELTVIHLRSARQARKVLLDS